MADVASETQTTQTTGTETSRRRLPRRGRRTLVRVTVLVAILLVLAAGAYFAWKYFSAYESTDDAQIDGHINAISARINGYVSEVLVDDEQYGKAGAWWDGIDPRVCAGALPEH